MTRKRTAKLTHEQHQEENTMTDPNDTSTADLLPEDPANDSQERAASLLQLERQAHALDQDNAPDPAQSVQDPAAFANAVADPSILSKQVQGGVGVLVKILSPALPSLRMIYTPQTLSELGDAVAPVMVKHGWSLGDVYEKYSEEITLAMVVIPLGMATYQGVTGDIAARKKAIQEQRQEQEQGAVHGG